MHSVDAAYCDSYHVCVSVLMLVIVLMHCAKTAGPIEMPFGKILTYVNSQNHVLDVGRDPPLEWVFGGCPAH